MSALKVLKTRLKVKTRLKSTPTPTMQRCPSNQELPNKNSISSPDLEQVNSQPFRRRARTYTGGVTGANSRSTQSSSSISPPRDSEDQFSTLDVQMTLSSPRHYFRRRALVPSELQGAVKSSSLLKKKWSTGSESMEDSDSLTVSMDVDGHTKVTDSVQTMESHSLRDMIEFLLMKHDIEVKQDLKDCSITATCSNGPVSVALDDPSTHYAGCYIDMRSVDDTPMKSLKEASSGDQKEKEYDTVKDCLAYFGVNGLTELPLTTHGEEDSYHLPRVPPIDPITDAWEMLPIDPQVRSALTESEMKQQRAIWELIQTEHSHLRILETIINVFMRCLELIRRVNLLSEDNYHSIFGYMEELYHAHEELWTYTFEPCINKTYDTSLPLDLNEIIIKFPKNFGRHFEVYEQHCALDSINLNALNKAMQNPDFNLYLKWCESRPECNRLELKQLLVTPMQRLTRYSLLLSAIAKKTADSEEKRNLDKIIEEVNSFVHVVDNTIRVQEETERVKDAMSRITSYSVVDIPHELRELVNPYTHLDLLAPMPDVELDKPRLLMVEGSLNFRDSIKPKMSAVYVFLFTDMLLITKPNRKASKEYTVMRPPFKITSLNLHRLDSESICCLVLNEYNALNTWFILKANNRIVAKEWMKQMSAAQQYYQDAVEKKTQTWKIMENLRSERILNGIENLENLNATLSQSLWSVHSYNNQSRLGSTGSSNESLLSKRASTSSLGEHPSLTHTTSADRAVGANRLQKLRSNFKSMGSVDFANICPPNLNGLRLERTSSEDKLNERPRSLCDMGLESGILGNNLIHLSLSEENEFCDANGKSGQLSPALDISRKMLPPELTSLRRSSYLSDDSGTEGSDTNADDSQLTPRHRRLSEKGRGLLATFTKKFSDPGDSMTNSSDSLRHQQQRLSLSFPESSHPLISISSRSPSPRFDEKLAKGLPMAKEDSTPTTNGMVVEAPKMDTLKVIDTLHEQMVTKATKRHSVGSLGDAKLQNLWPMSFNTLPSPRRMSQLVNSQNSSSSLTTGNLHTRSRSESCLLSASHGSHFDIVYVDPNYTKPKVATVEEEEEALTNGEQFKLSDESTTDESLVRESVLRLSSDEAPTPPKSATKSKVMFSELTEVHSFFQESGAESEMDSKPNSPSKRPLSQAWRQVTSTEPLSESPTESFQVDTSLPGEPKAFEATLDDEEMLELTDEERRQSPIDLQDIDVQLVKINLAKPPERSKSTSLLSEVIDAYSQSLFRSELPATEVVSPYFETVDSKPKPNSKSTNSVLLQADSRQPSPDSAQQSSNPNSTSGSAPTDTDLLNLSAPKSNFKSKDSNCKPSDSKPPNSDSKPPNSDSISPPSKPSDSKPSGSKPPASKPLPPAAATGHVNHRVHNVPTRTTGPLTTLPPVRRATRFTQQRLKKDSKTKQQPSAKSVRELSKMFEAPAKSSVAEVVPQSPTASAKHSVLANATKIGNGKSAVAKPSSGTQRLTATTKPDHSTSKPLPDMSGRRVSASQKRKESVPSSKIPTPSSSPRIQERRRTRVSTSTANGITAEGSKPKSLSRSTPSPALDTKRQSLFSIPETNGTKSAANDDGRSPKTQRSKRSPSTNPKPVAVRARLRTAKQYGGSSSSKDSKVVSSNVPRGNSNCSNNMDVSGAEYACSPTAGVATLSNSDVSSEERESPQPQPSGSIFRPKRHYSDSGNQFEEGSNLRKKLMKQHFSVSDIDRVLKRHPTTHPVHESSHRYSAISRSQTFRSTNEWMNFGASQKNKSFDEKNLLQERHVHIL